MQVHNEPWACTLPVDVSTKSVHTSGEVVNKLAPPPHLSNVPTTVSVVRSVIAPPVAFTDRPALPALRSHSHWPADDMLTATCLPADVTLQQRDRRSTTVLDDVTHAFVQPPPTPTPMFYPPVDTDSSSSTTSGLTLQSAQRQTTARHRTASCTSRSTVELHTDALHLARQLAGTLQQQLEAARQDANARELQQRKEVSTAQETSRRIADAAAIREERMYDQFNAFMERSRADLLQMAEQKERAAKLEAQLQASSSAPTAAAAMTVGQRQPVPTTVSEIKQFDNAYVVSSSSTNEHIYSHISQNIATPAVTQHNLLVDIEEVEDEPQLIFSLPNPSFHPMHTTQDSLRAIHNSAITSGLQTQQTHTQNISSAHSNPHTNVRQNISSSLQTAADCQSHDTHTIHSALASAAMVMDYQHVHMSPAYTHTPQLHQPTPGLQPTSTLSTTQHQPQCVAAQPHTATQPLLPSSHPVSTLSHSHQHTPATYPWLLVIWHPVTAYSVRWFTNSNARRSLCASHI